MNTTKKSNYIDTIYLAILEAITALIIVLVYLLIGKLQLTVVLGAFLGAIVTVINFLILSVAVNNAINKYLALIGDKELSEEEAQKFAKQHTVKIQAAISKSYVLRSALMIGILVVAFLTKWFDPLAALIPLLMYKPLIYVIEFIKKKRGE